MSTRSDVVAAARGDQPFDLLIQNTQLVNVLTGTIYAADIGIRGNRIALAMPVGAIDWSAAQTAGQEIAAEVIDGAGTWAVPGFVDGHVHNESSMCTPARWAEVIMPRGTTTVCTDPHEIGNVLGLDGVRYMLAASEGLPLRYFVTAPSCVPAVPSVETAGAEFAGPEADEMLSWERVVAIAEAMDYPGLIAQSGNVTPIVEAGHRADVPIEGHAPTVGDRPLQAYLAAAGPRSSDHEEVFTDTMVQKVQGGMMIYARASTFMDGSGEVAAAMERVNDTRLFGICTDDVMPHHLLGDGHMDYGMRCLLARGVDPVKVVQMATINVAQHYGLWGLGAIAPGWLADVVLLDDLESVRVRDVIADGQVVVRDGALAVAIAEPTPPMVGGTVRLPALSEDSFRMAAPVADGAATANAIDMTQLFTELTTVEVACEGGRVALPLPEGVTLAAIVPRHGQGTPPSLALLAGYPLARGAIASTISHDSHNLAIIGKDPGDMLRAAQALAECGGGMVAVEAGEVIGCLPLPIAGLMSPDPVAVTAERLAALEAALPRLGLPAAFPMAVLALALPVFPRVRLTDKGLVDVATQQFVALFVEG